MHYGYTEAEKIFAIGEFECERYSPSAAGCSLRLRLFASPSVAALSPPSLAPIKGRSLLLERRTRTSSSSRHRFQSLRCCCLPHPGLQHAPRVGTVGLRNRTSLSHIREKGDKVFGESSARLLTSSSRMPRTPTTTSPTMTTSPTSTTSSMTWRTPTPSPVPLLLLLSRTCFSPFYWRFCYSFLF